MEVRNVEGVATHNGPESCVGARKGDGEALTGERAGRVLSREIHTPLRGADAVERSGRPHPTRRQRKARRDPARSETPSTHGSTSPGNREIPRSPAAASVAGPHREVQGRTPMMNDRGKSDSSVVPEKPPNNAAEPAAEVVEGRGLAKGNSPEQQRRPGLRAGRDALRCARAGTSSSKEGSETAVHGAAAPRLRHRPPARGVLRAEAGRRRRHRRGDVAALRRGAGEPISRTSPTG